MPMSTHLRTRATLATLLLLVSAVGIAAAAEGSAPPSKGDSAGCIAVDGAQFMANAPGLLGKEIEMSGDFMVPPGVAPGKTNPNLHGFLFEPNNRKKVYAIINVDKIDQEDYDWMAAHLCSQI